ncbi:hypothetical protein TNCV_2268721 [Trichonephila clavipes]|nr:hypothetical protein TNCV_2268721 [Trichonephila clavipes]
MVDVRPLHLKILVCANDLCRRCGEAVNSKCLCGPPVDRDLRNAYPCSRQERRVVVLILKKAHHLKVNSVQNCKFLLWGELRSSYLVGRQWLVQIDQPLYRRFNGCLFWKQDEKSQIEQSEVGGMYARRPMICIPLTARYRASRRKYAPEHREWMQKD